MNILMTGGSGFIGTHLTRHLLNQGHHVRILDLRAPRHPPHSRLTWVSGDVRERGDLHSVLARPTDAVFHFAAIVSVPECEQDPAGSAQTNIEGTRNVAEAMLKCARPSTPFFFASSAAVYGDACKDGTPLMEDLETLQPVSHYGRQKLESERILQALARDQGLHALSFRFFNVFGEGQDPTSPYSGVITRFREAIRNQQEALLYNEGKNTRDFIAVTEIARACGLALSVPDSRLHGQAVNLCSGQSTSVSSLYEQMCQQAGALPRSRHLPPREGDIVHSCGNPARARELLGFEAARERNWWEWRA